MQCHISSRGKAGKVSSRESSVLEFLEKFSENNFSLSNAEGITCWSLDRGSIADLPLLKTLLAICQESQKLGFLDVIDSFVL